jgi:hypothetical protein
VQIKIAIAAYHLLAPVWGIFFKDKKNFQRISGKVARFKANLILKGIFRIAVMLAAGETNALPN